MANPLAQFEIDETEEGYILHVGDGQQTQSYSLTHDQMAAIIETFFDMLPEDEDEIGEEDEDAVDDGAEETPPRLS